MFRITLGFFPYKGMNEKNLFTKVLKGDLKIPQEASYSLENLLNRMLSMDPKKRPSADELLASEWMNT